MPRSPLLGELGFELRGGFRDSGLGSGFIRVKGLGFRRFGDWGQDFGVS